MRMTEITRETTVRFNLGRLMRQHKVTIRELARRMGITQKVIRRLRSMDRVCYLTYCDFSEAITGKSVFCRGRYRAINAQLAKIETKGVHQPVPSR